MDEIVSEYKEVLLSCFSFEGRLNRRPFWTYAIITFLIQIIAFCIMTAVVTLTATAFNAQNGPNLFAGLALFAFMAFFIIFELILGISTLGPQARRLRDGGFSPWLLLLHLCQFSIVVLVLLCLESKD